MILHSSSATTVKQSDSSFPTTTIHCSPLQNQFRSLQDVNFNLQSSHFTVYAEIGANFTEEGHNLFYDSENTSISALTISCNQINNGHVAEMSTKNEDETCSNHTYTLPDDANICTLQNLSSSSSSWNEEQWSPLLIREKQERRHSEPTLQLIPHSDSTHSVPLDDSDTTCSHSGDNWHDRVVVFQQYLPQPISRHSLTEQSFSFGNGPDHHKSLLPLSCSHPPLSDKDENTSDNVSFSFLLHSKCKIHHVVEEHADPVDLCSSSSSSGCTDLSKYSGDYERDPDYMKALADKMLASPDSERTGVDSGLDGIYSPLSPYTNQNEKQLLWQSMGYKSLDNLTKNPTPIYAVPVCGTQEHNSVDSFVTITV